MRAATLALITGLLGLASAPLPGQSPPRYEIELRDGSRLAGQLVGWSDGVVRLALPDGTRSIPQADVVLVTAIPADPSPVAGGGDVLVLAGAAKGAERLSGLLVGGDELGLAFALPGSGALRLPFEAVERILPATRRPLDRLLALEGDALDDRVWLLREGAALDSLSGVLERIEATQIVFDGALGRSTFAMEEVAAIVLAGTRAPPPPGGDLPVLVALAGGSRFGAGLVAVDGRTLRLETGFAGPVDLPLVVVTAIVPRGPKRVLLAELDPVEVDERPAIGGPQDVLFPWQRELSVSGRALVVGGVARATGLGVHAHSRLVYAVPQGARRLRVTAGLCDEVAALPADASMTFALVVDGERRVESEVLREGDAPVVLALDGLAGAARVELIATDAGDLDAGDRGAWVDALFLLD